MIHNGAPNSQVMTGVIKITIIAVRFTLRSMLPSRCQLTIKGPKDRCSRNQRSSRAEERANAKAAISRNGVVGNNGTTTPTAPMTTDVRPANSQNNLIPEFTLAVHHTRTGTGKSGNRGRTAVLVKPGQRASADLIVSAIFSAIMMVGAFVLPETKVGMMDASTIRRACSPRTWADASTTAVASEPMRQVPTG